MTHKVNASRRGILKATGALAAGLGFFDIERTFAQQLDATPACHAGEATTIRQTEGPYFKPRSPERSELIEPGINGQPIEIAGFVLTCDCRPLSGVLIDVWQADGNGNYDNSGFRLRGHQFTDAEGRYRLRSVVPGTYEGRTRHIHVKVQPAGGRILTTQLYFPGEAKNQRDGLFRKELLVRTATAGGWLAGRFDFVLEVG
jgi:protocatechuate 3,4-dioxygenase beta subunit